MKEPRARLSRWLVALSVVSVLYFILVGGTPLARSIDVLWTLNIFLSAALVTTWFVLMRRYQADRYDGIAVAALVLFCVAGAASRFPRQSFDAATGALAYVALFGVARRILTDRRTRELTFLALASTGLAVGIAFSLVWLAIDADWLKLSGYTILPPLSLQVLTGPFANRYDVMFLVLLLAPAVWFSARGHWRRAVLGLSLVTTLIVAIVAGSRGALVAIVVATVATWVAEHRRLVPSGRGMLIGTTAAAAVILAAWTLGLLGTFEQRLLYVSSILLRFELWSSSLGVWLQRPLTGMGPGTFPFDLQFTSYFSHAATAVRHPDNALVQAAAETGVLGLIALGLIVWIGVAFCLRRSTPSAARWTLVFFAVACASANPSDFPFLVVPTVIWGALAAPPPSATAVPSGSRLARVATVGLAAAVLVVSLDLAAARFFHTAGKTAWTAGDVAAARNALAIAIVLDPSMALYRREQATIELDLGNTSLAERQLRMATRLAPSDTTAWRARALAELAVGDRTDALDSASTAARLRPSETENLVVLAYVEVAIGRRTQAEGSMREALRLEPQLAASDGWESLGLDRRGLVSQALSDWRQQAPPLDSQLEQPGWLAFLASNPALVERAAAQMSGDDRSVTRQLGQLLECHGADARQALSALAPRVAETINYWEVRALAEGLGSGITSTTVGLGRRVVPAFTPNLPPESIVGPTTVDIDGYRITPFPAISVIDLPTPRNGRIRLLFSPRSVMDGLSAGGSFACPSSDAGAPP